MQFHLLDGLFFSLWEADTCMLSTAKIVMEVKGIGSTKIQIRTQIIGTSGCYGENLFLIPAPAFHLLKEWDFSNMI